MGHVNPHYNPEWKKVHDHHAAERARLENERDRLIAAGKMSSDDYKQVKANFDRDCLEIGGQAAIATGGHRSLAGRNFCPKPKPSVPL